MTHFIRNFLGKFIAAYAIPVCIKACVYQGSAIYSADSGNVGRKTPAIYSANVHLYAQQYPASAEPWFVGQGANRFEKEAPRGRALLAFNPGMLIQVVELAKKIERLHKLVSSFVKLKDSTISLAYLVISQVGQFLAK